MALKKLRWLVPLILILMGAVPAHAQYNSLQGWCEDGNKTATISGIDSTNTLQASYPQCTVTVTIHGGGTATIYSTPSGSPLANPFTADANGQWLFYADPLVSLDVTISGGTPIAMPAPVVYYTDLQPGGGGGGLALLPRNNVWTGTNEWDNLSKFVGNTVFCGKRPWRDVMCYGAVGDGSTDDSAAIQTAIDDACANAQTGGGTVRFPSPPINYYLANTLTVDLNICTQIYLLGDTGPRPGGISQFSRAPRIRVQGDAQPLLEIDNSGPGADAYVTIENLDFVALAGKAIKVVDLPFFLLNNVGVASNYDPMVTRSAALSMEGSILWFKAENSNFTTTDHNTGPFNPTPPKVYDPTSWTPPAVLMYGNSTHDGSVLFNFDNDTWAFGGFKIIVGDNGTGSCGQTFGEVIMNMNVIEGQFASPLIQFENAQSADCVGSGATLARITMIESQLADVAHPTPIIAVKGQSMHTASLGSVFMLHNLSHMSCYVLGINGQENISGIWTDNPSTTSYACDETGLPAPAYSLIRHTNGGLDYTGPAAGPTRYSITDSDGGPLRTFIADGTHSDTLAATMMLDFDGKLYYGPGGTSGFDLQSGRTTTQTWGTSISVEAPTGLMATPSAGGTIPDGSYTACVAAGDRNNSPFTVSPCSAETSFVMGAGNNTVQFSWTPPVGYVGKFTIYVGSAGAGSENRAQNCGSPCTTITLSSYPVSNQVPSTVGTLLTPVFQVTPTAITHSFNTAFTGSFTAAPTVNRTWTMPDATTTIVGTDVIQTLSNKTLVDSSTIFGANGALTKTAGLDLSGATAGFKATLAFIQSANRTYTFPNATGTVCLSTGNCTNYPTLYDCGATDTCTPVLHASPHIFIGSAPLNGASPSAVTVSGIAPAFTSNATYKCTVSDETAVLTDMPQITYASGSSFTITTATNTITDQISFVCTGY